MDNCNFVCCIFTIRTNIIKQEQVLSKKIIIGLISGLAAGAAISAILYNRKKDTGYSEDDIFDDNDMLDQANDFLLNARIQADEMVNTAEEKSLNVIKEAGQLLSIVKEKTAKMYETISGNNNAEAEKIKEEIEAKIEEFRGKL